MSIKVYHSPENRAPWGLDVIQLDDLRKGSLTYRIKDFENGDATYYKIKRTINTSTNINHHSEEDGYYGVLMDYNLFQTWLTNATGPYTTIDRLDASYDYASLKIQRILAIVNREKNEYFPHLNAIPTNAVYYIKRTNAGVCWDGAHLKEGNVYGVTAVIMSYAFYQELKALQP